MREQGTLLGQLERDVLLGLFAGGPVGVALWIAVSFIASRIGTDQGYYVLSNGASLLLCVLVFCRLRPRYPYLAWSALATALLSCSLLSLLCAGMLAGQY